MSAVSRLASRRSAATRYVSRRLALRRLALARRAPWRLAPSRSARLRSARSSTALERSISRRSARSRRSPRWTRRRTSSRLISAMVRAPCSGWAATCAGAGCLPRRLEGAVDELHLALEAEPVELDQAIDLAEPGQSHMNGEQGLGSLAAQGALALLGIRRPARGRGVVLLVLV